MAEWPRSGVPLALADWDDFEERTAVLCRAAEVPDYTYFWWKLRPHSRLGTVEVRAIDVQSDLADTGALVALVHVLAAEAAERPGLGSEPSREILDEGGFRAARYGVEATLPDVDGRLRPVAALLDDVLRRTSTHARELGCEDELGRLPELLRRGGGAGRQRALVAQHGLDALSGALARRAI